MTNALFRLKNTAAFVTFTDYNSNFSETVPQSVWNELPANLKKEIAVEVSDEIKSHYTQRRDYDLF